MKKMKTLILALILGTVGTVGIAAAQNKPAKKPSKCQAIWKKDPKAACKIGIDESEDIETGRAIPMGDQVYGNHKVQMGSLMRVRTNFLDRIVASAEDL